MRTTTPSICLFVVGWFAYRTPSMCSLASSPRTAEPTPRYGTSAGRRCSPAIECLTTRCRGSSTRTCGSCLQCEARCMQTFTYTALESCANGSLRSCTGIYIVVCVVCVLCVVVVVVVVVRKRCNVRADHHVLVVSSLS